MKTPEEYNKLRSTTDKEKEDIKKALGNKRDCEHSFIDENNDGLEVCRFCGFRK